MRTADHMNLSRYIMDHMNAGTSKLQKAAFIFGSIEPDINMDAGYGKCKYGSSWTDWNGRTYKGGVGLARRKKVQYIEIEPTTKTWLRNFIKITKQLVKNNLKLPLALFSEVCYYKSRQRRQMNQRDSFGAFFVSTMGTEGTGTSVPRGE